MTPKGALNPRGRCMFRVEESTKRERTCGLKVLALIEEITRPTNADRLYCRRHKRVVLKRLGL